MRKISITALLLALIFVFSGCRLIVVNEERELQRTVIKVEDHEITKEEYTNTYYNNAYLFYLYGYSDFDDDDVLAYLEEYSLDDLITQEILLIKAEEYGCYEFTEEELAEFEAEYEEMVEEYRVSSEEYITEDEENADLSEEELSVLIEEYLQETLEYYGYDDKEVYIGYLKDSEATDRIIEIITETDEPTESEIQAAYDELVAEQEEEYLADTSAYETDVSNGATIYYNLPSVRKARHILISLPEDVQEEIATLREEEDDEAAELLLQTELANIKDQADMVYDLAVEGADFDELIEEYGEDDGMADGAYYTVINGSTTYVEEFTDGLFSLDNVGDFTSPVASDYGYHIILYYGDVEEGGVPLEDVKDEISEDLIAAEEEELYADQLDVWLEEADIKIYYRRLDVDLSDWY